MCDSENRLNQKAVWETAPTFFDQELSFYIDYTPSDNGYAFLITGKKC